MNMNILFITINKFSAYNRRKTDKLVYISVI